MPHANPRRWNPIIFLALRIVLNMSGTLHTLEEHSLLVQEERAARFATLSLQQGALLGNAAAAAAAAQPVMPAPAQAAM